MDAGQPGSCMCSVKLLEVEVCGNEAKYTHHLICIHWCFFLKKRKVHGFSVHPSCSKLEMSFSELVMLLDHIK